MPPRVLASGPKPCGGNNCNKRMIMNNNLIDNNDNCNHSARNSYHDNSKNN